MNNTLKGYILGLLSTAILASTVTYAANRVKIVIDNKELIPTDVNGNRVDPIIIDGTTYLPIRAVANALGKAVYWDGPNYTVYLGKCDPPLEYPTVRVEDLTNIGTDMRTSNQLSDNYGKQYSTAFWGYDNSSYQYLLDMKYTKFKCTLYVPKGMSENYSNYINIETDGKIVYTSPEITKTSRPIDVEVDIRGCNNFKINFSNDWQFVHIGNAGFYQ